MSVVIPSSWSPEVQEHFVPIKSLGVGGFGSVWLAKRKTKSESYNDDDPQSASSTDREKVSPKEDAQNEDEYVAIKVVGHPHNQKISSFVQMSESGYFHREVSVLQEISHQRIVKCLEVYESFDPKSSCAPYCMVLEFCRGPTLEKMIKYGGALGIYFAQEVSSQLIDAVSYLHGRAVVHRDIKPDNIIIRGAKLDDDACWSDDTEGKEAAMVGRWNIKLIDFGFARPLREEDIINKHFLKRNKEPTMDFFGKATVDSKLYDKSLHQSTSMMKRSSSHSLNLSNSVTRINVLDLSAVGHRDFAAPEVKNGVHVYKNPDGKTKEGEKATMAKQQLTEHVSDYGMIVDAFSIGATVRYMCTGVPPHMSIEEFLRERYDPILMLGRMVCKLCSCSKGEKKQEKRFRSTSQLPKEAVVLIIGLTHWNVMKRTTVRSAREYEWIKSSYSMENSEGYPIMLHGNIDLDFLKCAM